MNLMMTFAGDPTKQNALSEVNDQCKEVLKVYLAMYVELLKNGSTAAPAPKPNVVPPSLSPKPLSQVPKQ